MRQADVMMVSEANAWLERNFDRLGKVDPVTATMDELGLKPATALEVGCANGWRIAKWAARGINALGVEPSSHAVTYGHAMGTSIRRGTADMLPVHSGWAELLVYGFCLYLTDPEDWFRIAAEGDRVLKLDGHLIIHDFYAGASAEAVPYQHDLRLRAYHFDFAQLWRAHPGYHLVRRIVVGAGGDEAIIVLRKGHVT